MAKKLSKAEICRRAAAIRRDDLGLTESDLFSPHDLAAEHGIEIYALDRLDTAGCPAESIAFFLDERPNAWSAALVPAGNGMFIVENTAHTPQRRRSNIAHELGHMLLEHEFDRILFAGEPGKGCRNPTSKDQEWEADELGGELLIPIEAAKRAARAGKTDDEVATEFDVSTRMAAWRMNSTGARIIAQRIAAKWGARSRW